MKNLQAYLANFINSKLFINKQGLDSLLLFLSRVQDLNLDDDYSYTNETSDLCKKLSTKGVPLTVNYSNQELVDSSVALHRVEGTIFADQDPWDYFFSTSALIQNLVAADNNPKIGSHLLYIYSGGGEAYMLDEATNIIANLKKPVIAVTYKYNCSAAYHISCAADRIYATNRFDTIGCIGSMMSGLDIIPYFEKLGMKYYEIYADPSSEKNSRIRELKNGNPEPVVKEELNLLAENFVDTVKNFRGITDEHVLAGQDYYANVCEDLKLIDGIVTLDQAVAEAYNLAKDYTDRSKKIEYAINNLI
nr:S49 family peptidase [uncultured Butyricimonas sp.]DAZ13367.1 MAG TPA: hypothetical protein [Caudoviricetes sp.]